MAAITARRRCTGAIAAATTRTLWATARLALARSATIAITATTTAVLTLRGPTTTAALGRTRRARLAVDGDGIGARHEALDR